MNTESIIPTREIKIVMLYYLKQCCRFGPSPSGEIAGPFESLEEARKARRKFIRNQKKPREAKI